MQKDKKLHYPPALLNRALFLSLEWGEHWLTSIQGRLKEREAFLTDDQLNELDHLCRQQVQSFAWRQFEGATDDEQAIETAKQKIQTAFPWINSDNLDHLSSQGQYYARK